MSNPDIETDRFSVEAKHRRELPAWLVEPLQLVRKHAASSGKTGICVWHPKGAHDSLVVLSLADFRRLVEPNVNESQ